MHVMLADLGDGAWERCLNFSGFCGARYLEEGNACGKPGTALPNS